MVVKLTVSLAPPVAGHEAFHFRQTGTVNRVPDDSEELYTLDGTDV